MRSLESTENQQHGASYVAQLTDEALVERYRDLLTNPCYASLSSTDRRLYRKEMDDRGINSVMGL